VKDRGRCDTASANSNRALDVSRDAASGRLKSSIRVINLHAMTAAADAVFASAANEGGFSRPPDIKAVTPPSMEDTVELFHLCFKQAVAFRIIASTLLAEKNNVSHA